jgi:hypothetical protein
VKTDIPSGMLSHFIDLGDRGRKLPVQQLELVPPRFDPAHPDYTAIQAAVAGVTATASPSPGP